MTVGVNDVNEAPSPITIEPGPLSVDENTEDVVVTTLEAVDPDDGVALALTVDDTRFEVADLGDGNLVLRLAAGQTLDFEDAASVTVTVTATDGDGLTSERAITFDVNDVNEAPGGGGLSVWSPASVEAGLRRPVLTNTPVIVDPEGDALTYELVTAPTQGTLFSGAAVTTGRILTQAEFDALTYQAPEAAGAFTAQFKVSDGVNTTPLSLSLTVSAPVNGTYTGNADANTLDGGAGNDSVVGLQGDDTLYGGIGNDTLDGGTGVDSMIGGAGDDRNLVDNACDVVVETAGGGTGRIESSVSYVLAAGVEVEALATTLQTGTGSINLTGNDLDQSSITGNAANNVLSGLGGNDTLFGQKGADTLDGGSGDDMLDGGTGTDVFVFLGKWGNDQIAGLEVAQGGVR